MQPEADREIHGDAGEGDRDHYLSVRDLGLTDPGDRFPSDEDRNQHERDRVCEGCEDADAMVAKGHRLMGRLTSDPECVPAEPKGRRVGEVMARIR